MSRVHQRYINSEQLRSSINIQVNTPGRGANGETTANWADGVTARARKVHKNSREFYAAQKVNDEVTDLFIVRFRTGVTTKNRVRFGTRYYDIIGAPDPDDKKRELHLLCKEVL